MQKCNWCNNPINGGPFSNYCSKRCEKDAVANGEKKGTNYSGFGILGIIVIALSIGFKNYNSDKKQEPEENAIEEFVPTESKQNNKAEENLSSESVAIANETNPKNEIPQDNLASDTLTEGNSIQESVEQNETIKSTEEIAVDLLRNGNSVREVANSTGLSRREVRKIRRNME